MSENEFWQASPYQYVRMIIRGPFNEFPGNHKMDYAGEDPDSPLMFNVFNATGECFIDEFKRDFFIYIRLMQYLTAQSKEISFSVLKRNMAPFLGSPA